MSGEWIEWNGGDCPVHEDTLVDFKRRCDTEPESEWRPEEFRAGDLRWSHRGGKRDIVAYRIIPDTDHAAPPKR